MTVSINPGDVIDGSYVIERLLGEGGMGAVFIAREERLGRRVAIKVLLPAVSGNPEAVARFEREARSAAALQSDHVTRVLSVGRLASGGPYIVMELLEGEDLAAMLASRGPLPAGDVIGFMTNVCEALSEAHAMGIVHRDLKPANVFLSRRPGGETRVKVLDFGISKSATGSGSASLTATTALMGTPLYMSPEQLREARNVDGRSDIWALGIMMYELLSGKPPFVSDALAELCVFIMTTPHETLISHRPDIPPELDAIVNRCLRKDPGERYANVELLMAALAAVPPAGSPRAAAPAPLPRMATPRMNPNPMAGLPTEAVGARRSAEAPPAYAPPPHGSGFVAAATVDPVSTTQPLIAPTRPSMLGLGLVFVGALAIGGAALYALVLRPGHESEIPATASGIVEAPAARASEVPASPSAAPAPISSATAAASQAIIVARPLQPTVIPPAPPLPPPVAPTPVAIKPPASARVTPTARPPAQPVPNPGSLMPKGRND